MEAIDEGIKRTRRARGEVLETIEHLPFNDAICARLWSIMRSASPDIESISAE